MKILIIEGNTLISRLTSHLFKQLGYKCDLASNDNDALNLINRNIYSLILVDTNLPKTNNIALIKAIHSMTHSSNPVKTHICGVATDNTNAYYKACLNAGLDSLLPKPLDGHIVVNLICRAKLQYRTAQTQI